MFLNVVLTLMLAMGSLSGQDSPQVQQPTDFVGVELKNRAPVSDEILNVTLPKPTESRLGNGMELLVLEDHRSPTIQIQIDLPASRMNIPPERIGIDSATTALMVLGTQTRNAREIAETQAELGASVSFSVGDRYATVRVAALTENLDEVLELAKDMLFNPTFPEVELQRWKNRQLTQLQQLRSIPAFLAEERMRPVLYPDDNRGLVIPSAEAIQSITREMIVDYYENTFRPEEGRVAVVGDTTVEEMDVKLGPLFEDWTGAAPAPPELEMRSPIGERKIYLIDRPDSVQTVLQLANRAFDRTHPDYIPAMVMNRVLGGGPASRLFRNLREEKGYTYGIGSGFSATHYVHHFSANTSVRSEVTAAALSELLEELRRIREELVPADELAGAKRALVASFALSTERPQTALSQALTVKDYGLPEDYWDTYPREIAAVTAEDVLRVAREYVPLDNVQIVVVGDAARIREELAAFGTIEEYDAEGNRIE